VPDRFDGFDFVEGSRRSDLFDVVEACLVAIATSMWVPGSGKTEKSGELGLKENSVSQK
jgi:hypothetical protein